MKIVSVHENPNGSAIPIDPLTYQETYHRLKHDDLLTNLSEVLLEAENYDDRMTWFTTIKHHINYLELRIQQLTSLIPHPVLETPTSSIFSHFAAPMLTTSGKSESSSTSEPESPFNKTRLTPSMNSAHQQQGNNQFLFNEEADDLRRPWKRHFHSSEEEIFSGNVCKPDLNQKKRLVLVKNEEIDSSLPFQIPMKSPEPTGGGGGFGLRNAMKLGGGGGSSQPQPATPQHHHKHRHYRRLLYIDLEKNIVKGQIKWYHNEKPPKVRKVRLLLSHHRLV